MSERESERERESVCVCERERERAGVRGEVLSLGVFKKRERARRERDDGEMRVREARFSRVCREQMSIPYFSTSSEGGRRVAGGADTCMRSNMYARGRGWWVGESGPGLAGCQLPYLERRKR